MNFVWTIFFPQKMNHSLVQTHLITFKKVIFFSKSNNQFFLN
jgi:hypothetical protein